MNKQVFSYLILIYIISMLSLGCQKQRSDTSSFPDNIKRAPTDPNCVEYMLLVSLKTPPEVSDYDNDKVVAWQTGDLNGYAICCINESPIFYYTQAEGLLPISEWLVPGENHIAFTGDFKRAFYFKIFQVKRSKFKAPDWTVDNEVCKSYIEPSEEEEAAIDYFNVDFDYKPFYDELSYDTDEENDATEKDATSFLTEVILYINDHNSSEFIKHAIAPWEARPRWGKPKKEYDEWCKLLKDTIDNDNNILITKPKDFRIDVGKYSAIAWSEYTHPENETVNKNSKRFHSFVWKTIDGKKINWVPLRLVRINGKWEIWP
jgi:hypothetical protein